jgi:hypothetical protein
VEISLDICVLSVEEAARLEVHGIWPSCKKHLHMTKAKADSMVEAEEHRYVGGPNTKVGFVSAVVPTGGRGIWTPVQCHAENGKALMGMRTWGLKATS